MTHPAIRVEGISKQYQVGLREKSRQTFREAMIDMAGAPLRRLKDLSGRGDAESTFWALRDISFDVPEGEVLGIIGHNGAGKSTLLKILSRITEPTEGRAVVHGRVASLLEVGTGFHNELTGRENIYLNGAILGMSKVEINRKFDEIVSFSGVERFLDTPIKRYSSGMKVRLAFAVAAHLEPEILIIDEVLAVGDQEFQNKCLGKMHDVATSGRTVLFVSHNMAAVGDLCSRVVLLQEGNVSFDGSVTEGLALYLHRYGVENHEYRAPESTQADKAPRLLSVSLHDERGNQITSLPTGRPLSFRFTYQTTGPHDIVHFAIGVYNEMGSKLLHLASRRVDGASPSSSSVSPDTTRDECISTDTAVCNLKSLPLAPAKYIFNVYFAVNGMQIDYVTEAFSLEITPPIDDGYVNSAAERKCIIMLPTVWRTVAGATPIFAS